MPAAPLLRIAGALCFAVVLTPAEGAACGLRLAVLGQDPTTGALRPLGQALNATPSMTGERLEAAQRFDRALADALRSLPGSEDLVFTAVALERMTADLAACAAREGGGLEQGGLASIQIDRAIRRSLPAVTAVLRARDGNRSNDPGASDAMTPLLRSERVKAALDEVGQAGLLTSAQAEMAAVDGARREIAAREQAARAREFAEWQAERAARETRLEAERVARVAERIRTSPAYAASMGVRATPTVARADRAPDAYQIRRTLMEAIPTERVQGLGFADSRVDYETGMIETSILGVPTRTYDAVDQVACTRLRAGAWRCRYRLRTETSNVGVFAVLDQFGVAQSNPTDDFVFTGSGSGWRSPTFEARRRASVSRRLAEESAERAAQADRDQQLKGWGCAMNPGQPGC